MSGTPHTIDRAHNSYLAQCRLKCSWRYVGLDEREARVALLTHTVLQHPTAEGGGQQRENQVRWLIRKGHTPPRFSAAL